MTALSKSFPPIIAATLALAGCSGLHVEYTSLASPRRPLAARPAYELGVFSPERPPTRRHIELGTIHAWRRGSNYAPPEAILNKILEDAARRGCDAIHVIGRADEGSQIGYRATCIVYDDAVPAVTVNPYDIAPQTTGAETKPVPEAPAFDPQRQQSM